MVKPVRKIGTNTMSDLDRLLLAIYKATIEADEPFAPAKPIFAALALPPDSKVGIIVHQRGFLADRCPVGSIALSDSGIRQVEERLRN